MSKKGEKTLKAFQAICAKSGVKVKDSYDLEKTKGKFAEAVKEGKMDPSKLDKDDAKVLASLGYDVKVIEPEPEKKEPESSDSSSGSSSSSSGSSSSSSGPSSSSKSKKGSSSSAAQAAPDGADEAKAGDAKSSDEEAGSSSSSSSSSGEKKSSSGSKTSEKPAGKDVMPPETKDDQTCREWLKEYLAKKATATRDEVKAAFEDKFGKDKAGTLHGTLYRAKSNADFLGGKVLVEEKVFRVVEEKAPAKDSGKKEEKTPVAKDEKKPEKKDKADKKKEKKDKK